MPATTGPGVFMLPGARPNQTGNERGGNLDKKVKFRLSGRMAAGRLVKENGRTVLVKLKSGKVIKRHKEKDQVELC